MAAPMIEHWERGVLPLGMIRDGRLVYANARLGEYLGYRAEEMIGTPFIEYVSPHDREQVRERHERRVRGESVTDSYDLTLLRRDGREQHAEIYVALEPSGEVTFELADRSHLVNRRAHLRDLAELGAAVQREHTEEGIFATLGKGLLGLGLAFTRLLPEGDGVRALEVESPTGTVERFESRTNIRIRGLRGRWNEPLDSAWRDGSTFMDDLPLAASRFFSDEVAPVARSVARETSLRRGIALRIDVGRKPQQILCVMGDWLLEEDLASFVLLRIQVSAALDAARVIADLSARNAELAALNSIGGAAGAGRDLDALFAITAEAMTRLLSTRRLAIYLFDEQTGDAVLAHHIGLPAGLNTKTPVVDNRRVMLDRVLTTGKPIVWQWNELARAQQNALREMQFTVAASVPLVAGARVIGVMNAVYDDEREILASHIEVLQAAGAHIAAAVRAKRLLDDLRQSYAELARAQEQLVRRERLAALGELAAIVAHEIRNPLGAVFNAVGAIRQQAHAAGDDRLATLLAILEEEATRMNDIVGDLLDFSRPVSAALRPEDVEPIVTDAIEAATNEATGPVRVKREIDENLPAVPIDGRLLRQAILNIALNAVQALGSGGGTVSVRLKRDDGAVRIEIADDGPGISGEHEARVFEPFFTTRASGTGLGLTVVKRIVDVHRGETTLHTAPGRGTTFVIRLPVA